MAEKIVLVPEDMGRGLKIEGNKVVVDTAALELPVDVHLSGVRLDETGKKLIFTIDGISDPVEVDVAKLFGTDTVVTAVVLDGTTLKITSSNGDEVSTDLAPLLASLQTQLDNLTSVTERLTSSLTTAVETLRSELVAKSELGDTLVSLGGVPLGRLVQSGSAPIPPAESPNPGLE